MIRKVLIALLSVCFCLPALASAPGYTTVISTLTTDASGAPLASGTATFSVLDANGNPLTVKLVNGGQITLAPVSVPVTSGAFTAQVIDVSDVQPSFPCVALTIVDNSTGDTVWHDGCLQPTGSTYSLDEFSTNTTPVAPQAGDTVEGNLGVNGNLDVTGTLTVAGFSPEILSADVTNGVYNASLYAGADILAKAQAAFAACSSNCTVMIPAGTYTASTTLTMPNTQNVIWLAMDKSAVINYTGTGCAINTPTIEGGTNHLDGISGGWIVGTSNATNGICIQPINHFAIVGTKVSGFTNGAAQNVGNGIIDIGGNSIEIERVSAFGNEVGIAITGQTSFSSNAVHITESDLSINNGWGFVSFDSHVSAGANNSCLIQDTVIENNGIGGADVAFSNACTITNDHFEQTGYNVRLNNGYNGFNNHVTQNYFIPPAGGSTVYVVDGFDTQVTDNYEDPVKVGQSTNGTCFIQVGNATRIDEQRNTIASVNERCWPGQNPGWSSQFDVTAEYGAVSNPTGAAVAFPNGVSSAADVTGTTVHSSSGNITSAACFEASGNGAMFCSGAGAPTISCSIGGSIWANTTAGSGTYADYICNNGTWQGLGTVR